jgi:hypothetical protein
MLGTKLRLWEVNEGTVPVRKSQAQRGHFASSQVPNLAWANLLLGFSSFHEILFQPRVIVALECISFVSRASSPKVSMYLDSV